MHRLALAAWCVGAAVSARAQTNDAAVSFPDIIIVGPKPAPDATGDRAESRAAKRLAPNLIEVQPQSEIRKLPDVNVADAIGRVPGISLESESGEGRFVNIRGLDADLNAVTLGGVRLLPTNPAAPFMGGRAVALDVIPASLVGGLQLTKTLRPDQDAEGLGGQIEIIPRAAPTDGRLHIDAEIIGGVEELRESPVVAGDVTLSGNFGYARGYRPWDKSGAPELPSGDFFTNPRPFSFVVTESNYNDQRGTDDRESDYSVADGAPGSLFAAVDLRSYQNWRRRYGRGGEFDYTPNDENSWFFRYIEAGYTEHLSRHSLNLSGLDSGLPCDPAPGCLAGPGGVGFLAPRTVAQQGLRDESETLQNRVITFGGDNLIGRVKLNYHGAFSEGSYSKPYDYFSAYINPNPFPLAYNNANSNHPSFLPLDGTSLTDPANYIFSGIQNSQQKVRDREWSGVANAAVPLDIGGGIGTAKIGGSVRLRTRISNAPSQTYSAAGDPVPFGAYAAGGDQIYYDNRYNIGPRPSPGVIGLIGTPGLVLSDPVGDGSRTAAAAQNSGEDVNAWYGQYDVTFGKLGILTGMRFEQTEARYGANTVSVAADGGSFAVAPTVNKQSYFDFFPSMQLRYAFDPTLIGRLAYSTAIARPGFNQITGSTLVDFGATTVTTGNPALKPTTADAFDVSIEKYLDDGGLISAGAFGKIFQHYILPRTTIGPYPGIFGVARIDSYADGGGANAYGIELTYARRFSFLPAPFDGLGMDANYTFVQSAVELRPGEGVEPLPSTSDHNFNVALYYEKDPVTLRIAGEYLSKNLVGVGANRDNDIFTNQRFHLDIGSRYRINEQFEAFVNALNLTDETLKYLQGQHSTRLAQRGCTARRSWLACGRRSDAASSASVRQQPGKKHRAGRQQAPGRPASSSRCRRRPPFPRARRPRAGAPGETAHAEPHRGSSEMFGKYLGAPYDECHADGHCDEPRN